MRYICLFATDFSDNHISSHRREDPDFEELQELEKLLRESVIPYIFIPDCGDPILNTGKKEYIGLEEVKRNMIEIHELLYEN